MLQIFKYSLKQLLRNRGEFFWVLIFPILLGSMFKVAFSNLTSQENYLHVRGFYGGGKPTERRGR